MNDIRKVLQKVSTRLRELAGDYQDDGSEQRELEALAFEAESLLASLPPDGGAWYPRASDLRAARSWWNWGQTQDATNEAIARLAIDLYRERGGQVGGDVVRTEIRDKNFPWKGWELFNPHIWDSMNATSRTNYETRELIARQTGAHPATVPAEVMKAAEWLPDWTDKGSQQGAYATLIRDWFRSIQGAGHEG